VIDLRSGREKYQPWDRHSGRLHQFSLDSSAAARMRIQVMSGWGAQLLGPA
jgi:hypothetical protein